MKKVISIIAVVLAVATLAGVLFYVEKANSGFSVKNAEEWITQAKELRAEGKNDDAFLRLELYLGEKPGDKDALTLMADWYSEDGKADKAQEYYDKASRAGEYKDVDLSPVNRLEEFRFSSDSMKLEIKPAVKMTKGMKLKICDENLAGGENELGRISYGQKDLIKDDKSFTTKWMDVKKGSTLVMSGGFNSSEWQFMTDSGEIVSYEDSSSTFHNGENVLLSNKSSSVVSVPEDCGKARVTYYNSTVEGSVGTDGNITVTYGKIPEGYPAVTAQEFDIPDLRENQSVVYSDGKWTLNENGKQTALSLPAVKKTPVFHMSVSGDVCGTVKVDSKELAVSKDDKNAVYGVTYNPSTKNVVCRRTGDAVNLSFDYKVGKEWVNGTGNDFDNAYPWSDIKLCNIYTTKSGDQNIFYKGSKYFSPEGKWGNVMVEIPKFYTRRVVNNGVESISISGTQHEGFELEPVFLNSDGSESDRVYVSAFLGAEKGGSIVSLPNAYPTLNMGYRQTLEKAEANGDGYSEMSLAMISALQKLFLVETGTLDSTSIISGDVNKNYYYKGKDSTAVKSEQKTNRIIVNSNEANRGFSKGTSIILLTGWDTYSNTKTVHREITDVKDNGTTIEIQFDGNPVNVTEKKTAISNIPEKTGKTNSLDYGTAVLEGEDGKTSFRYRYIENLYGSALVMIDDDAYISDGVLTLVDEYENAQTLGQKVAAQALEPSDRAKANAKMCAGKMTYDPENPLYMLPSAAGGGASAFSGYCDYWYYKSSADNRYILYGGTQDNGRLAGIFHMRAAITSDDFSHPMASARIMYRRPMYE